MPCTCKNGIFDKEQNNYINYEKTCDKCKKNGTETNGNSFENNTNVQLTRNADGTIKLNNPHIKSMEHDYLYHLALGTATHDLVEMFGDVKFVCIGGTADRMKGFAHYIMKEIGYKLPTGAQLYDITQLSHRYAMYKVGPVLSVNHGMGAPSVGILLHELIKLMYYAKVKDPVFIRIGTCGGIGLKPGTVVVANGAVNGMIQHTYDLPVLGKMTSKPAILNKELSNDLKSMAHPDDPFDTVTGITMCADDFYEGQGRLDGAFCNYSEADKMEFLKKLYDHGVRNIEMEATLIAGLTHHAGIRTAIVCVTLLNRLQGDQVLTPKEILCQWQERPQIIVGRYIKKHLSK